MPTPGFQKDVTRLGEVKDNSYEQLSHILSQLAYKYFEDME